MEEVWQREDARNDLLMMFLSIALNKVVDKLDIEKQCCWCDIRMVLERSKTELDSTMHRWC